MRGRQVCWSDPKLQALARKFVPVCDEVWRLHNLREHDWNIAPLWDSLHARAVRERIRDTHCKCTWECAQADNVLFHKRNWPRLARKVLGS